MKSTKHVGSRNGGVSSASSVAMTREICLERTQRGGEEGGCERCWVYCMCSKRYSTSRIDGLRCSDETKTLTPEWVLDGCGSVTRVLVLVHVSIERAH